MALDLAGVTALATDQAALKSAAGLAKPAKWSGAGASHDGHLVWGECAGSGANPYRVMADLRDLGNKCTCPSRKFPCKHALALLWVKAEAIIAFPAAETPEWVGDWIGRRRKPGSAAPPVSTAPKDLAAAIADTPVAADDPAAAARRAAQALRRADDTDAAIAAGLDALDQWVGDQLRLGLAGFLDDATARCRRIAARLVDAKAAVLAGRLDELPARLLALPAGDRVRGAVVELGKLVLLARAFRTAPRDPGVRRAIAAAESRETLLADPATLRIAGAWDVLAENVTTRRDGLIAQTSWLLNLGEAGPRFAMLVDFFPASAGRRTSVFTPGEQFTGEIAFYPAALPLRGLLLGRAPLSGAPQPWPAAGPIETALAEPLLAEPWTDNVPALLPPGRVATDDKGGHWWRARSGATILPIAGAPPRLASATDLDAAAAIWSGGRLELLAAQSPWGRIACHG